MSAHPDRALDRALGALTGLAIGDALGMPTQEMPRAWVRKHYGLIQRFEGGPAANPISAGLPAGSVTDDTQQAAILARLLIEGRGTVDPCRFAEALQEWEREMRAKGSADLLGPSTTAALAALLAGATPEESGRGGHTNGAAMRVTPVGISRRPAPMDAFVRAVADAGRVTHATTLANAGASAVAAAVSAGVAGADVDVAIAVGVRAARAGAELGHYVPGADVAVRIEWACDVVQVPEADALDVIDRLVGTSVATQESVPAAFALLARYPDDPWLACRAAASLGGDSDTIAAMVGAIGGACHGLSAFPVDAREQLASVNPDLDLSHLAEALLALRGVG